MCCASSSRLDSELHKSLLAFMFQGHSKNVVGGLNSAYCRLGS
jgi:hypothetical protein